MTVPDGEYTSYCIPCGHCKQPVRVLVPEGMLDNDVKEGAIKDALKASEDADGAEGMPVLPLCPFCGLWLSLSDASDSANREES